MKYGARNKITVEELNLKEGDRVQLIVKATHVLTVKED